MLQATPVFADGPFGIDHRVNELHDAVARVKARGHWQSDVIVGFGVGTMAGYYAHNRKQSFFLELLSHGVAIGLRKRW
ncbi:MAG: hypothetical protein WB402_02385 [Sulfuricaulis sp.]|uniref:hypothetical protein n=1 Tax=Sulfuricaulis sp. TaxID=2003553 RepID=UPI003C49A073